MLRLTISLSILLAISASSCGVVQKAIVTLEGGSSAKGVVTFSKADQGGVQIEGEIRGLMPGLHGFHIHALGDVSQGCGSTGPHLNPHNKNHGAPNATERHVGDLGNIEADARGLSKINFFDNQISLNGEWSIVGRAVVVHELADDLGQGGNEESLKTGNAGKRLICGVIGLLAETSSASATLAGLLTFAVALTNLRHFY